MRDVRWERVTPTTVTIFHKTGVATIPLEKLPSELQRRFGYDPNKIAERKAEALRQQQMRDAQRQAEYDRVREANSGSTIRVIPYEGDETPIQKIIAEPQAAIGKTLIVCGGVTSENYYNYNYMYASGTHYSLRFTQLNPNLTGGDSLAIYALRLLAKPLVNSITDAQAEGKAGKLVRLKITVTPRSFEDGQFSENAELVDWQTLNPDKASWSPWAIGSGR